MSVSSEYILWLALSVSSIPFGNLHTLHKKNSVRHLGKSLFINTLLFHKNRVETKIPSLCTDMHAFANIREPRPRTQPVTSKQPTASDKAKTQELIAYLKECNLYEPVEDSTKRESLLAMLNELIQNWCKELFVTKVSRVWARMPLLFTLQKGYSEDLINEAGPKIFTFGSYRLGVNGPGADIDTLCVFPSQIDRTDFFTTLLQKLMENPDITNITVSAMLFNTLIFSP